MYFNLCARVDKVNDLHEFFMVWFCARFTVYSLSTLSPQPAKEHKIQTFKAFFCFCLLI